MYIHTAFKLSTFNIAGRDENGRLTLAFKTEGTITYYRTTSKGKLRQWVPITTDPLDLFDWKPVAPKEVDSDGKKEK